MPGEIHGSFAAAGMTGEAAGEVIRVALVDDQRLVRSGFGMLINSQPDLQVVLEAGNGIEAIQSLNA